MDVADHAAAVWQKKLPILLVAVILAAAVLVWRNAATPTYVSTDTLQIRTAAAQSNVSSDQIDLYTQTVVGLVASRDVLTAALSAANLDDSVTDAADQVSAEAGTQTGFVTVSAEESSPQRAAGLASAVAVALSDRVASDQAGDITAERTSLASTLADLQRRRSEQAAGSEGSIAALNQEIASVQATLAGLTETASWQVVSVDNATVPTSPVSPKPLRDALFAFLVALIVVAEGLVLRRGWRGALSARDPAGSVVDLLDVPAVQVGPGDGPGTLAALLSSVYPAPTIIVASHGRRPSGTSAMLLARLIARRGDSVLAVDASVGQPTLHRDLGIDQAPGLMDLPVGDRALRQRMSNLLTVDAVRVLTLGTPATGAGGPAQAAQRLSRTLAVTSADCVVIWLSLRSLDDAAALLAQVDAPVVLDVDARTATAASVLDTVDGLQGLGGVVAAAIVRTRSSWARVTRSDRQVRRLVRRPDPAETPADEAS